MSTKEIEKTNNGAASPAPLAQAPVVETTISEKFLSKVQNQVAATIGRTREWTPLEKALAQNLFVKVDQQLAAMEVKRQANPNKKSDTPITWQNVQMDALALKATQIVSLELDASVPNHIHVIPYLNSRTKRYDVDLRIGYSGQDAIRRKYSTDPPLDIRYQLVHEGDEFSITQNEHGGEEPTYTPANYFKPGEVIGGFGHVIYSDARKNRVIICEYREFEKAQKASLGVEFWGGEQTKWENGKKVAAGFDERFRKEMQFKTLVHRVCKQIAIDPAKVHGIPVAAIEDSYSTIVDAQIESEIAAISHAEALALDAPEAPEADTATGEIINQAQPSIEEAAGY